MSHNEDLKKQPVTVLIIGPVGCGKSVVANIMAKALQQQFPNIAVDVSEIEDIYTPRELEEVPKWHLDGIENNHYWRFIETNPGYLCKKLSDDPKEGQALLDVILDDVPGAVQNLRRLGKTTLYSIDSNKMYTMQSTGGTGKHLVLEIIHAMLNGETTVRNIPYVKDNPAMVDELKSLYAIIHSYALRHQSNAQGYNVKRLKEDLLSFLETLRDPSAINVALTDLTAMRQCQHFENLVYDLETVVASFGNPKPAEPESTPSQHVATLKALLTFADTMATIKNSLSSPENGAAQESDNTPLTAAEAKAAFLRVFQELENPNMNAVVMRDLKWLQQSDGFTGAILALNNAVENYYKPLTGECVYGLALKSALEYSIVQHGSVAHNTWPSLVTMRCASLAGKKSYAFYKGDELDVQFVIEGEDVGFAKLSAILRRMQLATEVHDNYWIFIPD